MKKPAAPQPSRVWLAGVHPRLAVAMVVFAVIGAIVVAVTVFERLDDALASHIRYIAHEEAVKSVAEMLGVTKPTVAHDYWGSDRRCLDAAGAPAPCADPGTWSSSPWVK